MGADLKPIINYSELYATVQHLEPLAAMLALKNERDLSFDEARRVVRWGREGRYLRVVRWAEERYRDPETGELLIAIGREPSTYTRIERAAWRRYMEI